MNYIHVVGTNGKGSVANFLSQGLIKSGKKVGLFTSPHLFKPNERIQINNTNISDDDFFEIANKIPKMHFFSKVFLVALKYFDQNDVDVVILEAGIGGKNDVTNIIDGKIGVITSIGLDHENLLGSNIFDIAKEKAGIINPKMNFYYPSTLSKFLEIFAEKSEQSIQVPINSKNFSQANKELASYVLKQEFNIEQHIFKEPLGRVSIKEYNGHKMIFDVAHNIDGVKALLYELKKKQIEYDNIVFSFQIKKNVAGLEKILPKNKKIFFYKKNKHFHTFSQFNEIKDLNSLKGSTLFFGSFIFIGEIYEKY